MSSSLEKALDRLLSKNLKNSYILVCYTRTELEEIVKNNPVVAHQYIDSLKKAKEAEQLLSQAIKLLDSIQKPS